MHSVNCAWLVCGKETRSLAQYARRHGKDFLLLVITTGNVCYAINLYIIATIMHIMLLKFRANIESSYGHEVTQLRTQYTPEDKELIKEFLEAKKSFGVKSQSLGQKFAFQEGFEGEGLYDE